MHLSRFASGVVIPLMVGFGMAGNASATEGQGATVTETSQCRDFQGGVICSETRWVTNETLTPSGNYITTAIGDTSFTYTGPDGCVRTFSQKKREQWTNVGYGPPQEAHVLQVTESSSTCDGQNIQCTHWLHFLFAAGDSRIHKTELECAPVL
ncbi:MAG: hypothetical protein LC808_29040 [Actinobacteria bacterium]|nr:hypothetical protein [Actinomycetota bacterium]